MIDFTLKDIKFHYQKWTTPDGKEVPFQSADITELLMGYAPYDRFRDEADLCIEITRWPRKVTIHLIVTEGVDGYTSGGGGMIFEPVMSTKYTLVTTDRTTLELAFDQVMKAAYDKWRDLEMKGLWK